MTKMQHFAGYGSEDEDHAVTDQNQFGLSRKSE